MLQFIGLIHKGFEASQINTLKAPITTFLSSCDLNKILCFEGLFGEHYNVIVSHNTQAFGVYCCEGQSVQPSTQLQQKLTQCELGLKPWML